MKSSKVGFFFLGLMALVAVSQLLGLLWPAAGAYANSLILLLLLGISLWRPRLQPFIIVLAIIPIITCIEFVLPLTGFLRYIFVYGALMVLAITCKILLPFDEKLREKTDRKWFFFAPILGIMLGLFLFFGAGQNSPLASFPLWLAALLAPLFAFAEELFLRGQVQHQAGRFLPKSWAILFPPLTTMLLMIHSGSFVAAVTAAAASLALSTLYFKHPNLLLTTLANTTMKLMLIILLSI